MPTACPSPPYAPRFPVATLRCEYYLKLGAGGHRTPTSAGPAVLLAGCCEGGLSVATPHTADAYSRHTAPLLVTVLAHAHEGEERGRESGDGKMAVLLALGMASAAVGLETSAMLRRGRHAVFLSVCAEQIRS
jgi:hypothetical protein